MKDSNERKNVVWTRNTALRIVAEKLDEHSKEALLEAITPEQVVVSKATIYDPVALAAIATSLEEQEMEAELSLAIAMSLQLDSVPREVNLKTLRRPASRDIAPVQPNPRTLRRPASRDIAPVQPNPRTLRRPSSTDIGTFPEIVTLRSSLGV